MVRNSEPEPKLTQVTGPQQLTAQTVAAVLDLVARVTGRRA